MRVSQVTVHDEGSRIFVWWEARSVLEPHLMVTANTYDPVAGVFAVGRIYRRLDQAAASEGWAR